MGVSLDLMYEVDAVLSVGDREKNLPSWMPQVSTSIGKLFTSNTRHSTGQNGGSSGTQGSNFPAATVSRLGLFRNNSGELPPITHGNAQSVVLISVPAKSHLLLRSFR